MARPKAAQEPDRIIRLKPEEIVADDNIRAELREGDVDRMIASIVDRNGVQEPISVQLVEAVKGYKGPAYRLLKGFIRHAAVTKMNKSGLEFDLPAIVRPPSVDAADRLKTQVAENVARASLSPIDTAIAISKLLDAGVSRTDIRSIFARSGTSKGATVSPMSNAWLNIHLALLQLPADIISKIHQGEVSVQAAYELGRVPEERRAAVLERALEEVKREYDKEQKDEEKFLKGEQSAAKEAEKLQAADKAIEEARTEADDAAKMIETKTAALRVKQAEVYDPTDDKAKAAYMEGLKAAETDVKAAQANSKKAKNKLAKAHESKKKIEDLKAKLAAAQAGVKPAVGPTAVKKAAQADRDTPEGKAAAAKAPAGAAPAAVALTASQIRDGLKDLAKTNNPTVGRVVGIFSDFCKGVLTPKMAGEELEKALKALKPVAAKK